MTLSHDEAWDEALRVNEEIERRKNSGPLARLESAQDLADAAVYSRDHIIGEAFDKYPLIQETVQRHYRRRAESSGVAVYVDPYLIDPIGGENSEGIEEYSRYLESVDFSNHVEELNRRLPKSYRHISMEDLPPIFFHSPRGAEEIGDLLNGEDSAGQLAETGKLGSRASIHIIPTEYSSLRQFEQALLREIIHSSEDANGMPLSEGLAESVSLTVTGYDVQENLASSLQSVENGKDHPLSQVVKPLRDGEPIDLSLLFEPKIGDFNSYEHQKGGYAQAVATHRAFSASFVEWAQREGVIDEHYFSKDENEGRGNYRVLIESIKATYGGEVPAIEEFSLLASGDRGLAGLVMRDSDPLLSGLVQELRATPPDQISSDEIKKKYLVLSREIRERLQTLSVRYSTFVKTSLDATETAPEVKERE